MTMQPRHQFKCDRCAVEAYVVVYNAPHMPVPPEGWQALRVNENPSQPALHLCPPCASGLNAYLGLGATRLSDGQAD